MLYTDNTVFGMLEFLVENLFLDFGGNSMFVLYKKKWIKREKNCRSYNFNLIFQYINDVLLINNPSTLSHT